MKDICVLHKEYSVFFSWQSTIKISCFIISGQIVFFLLFKFYWFRLKTIKSGQNHVSLAVAGSHAFKNQSLQRCLYKLPRTQHLLKARLHGSMEVNSYFPFTTSQCHWKKVIMAQTCFCLSQVFISLQ